MEKWYKITGITDKLYEGWKDDLREDIVVYKENDEWQFRIRLNWLEAIYISFRMLCTNMNNPYVLKLERDIRKIRTGKLRKV